jgi:hypothetical protein
MPEHGQFGMTLQKAPQREFRFKYRLAASAYQRERLAVFGEERNGDRLLELLNRHDHFGCAVAREAVRVTGHQAQESDKSGPPQWASETHSLETMVNTNHANTPLTAKSDCQLAQEKEQTECDEHKRKERHGLQAPLS